MLSLKVWFVYTRCILLLSLSVAILECENAAKLVQKLRGPKVNLHCIGLRHIELEHIVLAVFSECLLFSNSVWFCAMEPG